MTSEILYTYIWRKEEVIKPYGPLPYSRKHSTNLLTWFIITLCNLAKPTLQLFERKNPAEKQRERTYMGELWLREARVFLSVCGRIVQARPCWQHHVWVRGVQILQLGNNRKHKWICFQPARLPLALLWWQGWRMGRCRGEHQKLFLVTRGARSCSIFHPRSVQRGWKRLRLGSCHLACPI